MSLPTRTFNYHTSNTWGNINIQNGTFGSIVAPTGITTGGLAATTITSGNMNLSGNLNIAGTLTAVNITTTNVIQTNISHGTLTSTFSNLTNVRSTNISTGILNAPTGITTAGLSATTITGGNMILSGNVSVGGALRSTVTTSFSTGSLQATSITATNINLSGGSLEMPTTGFTSGLAYYFPGNGTIVSRVYDDTNLHFWTDDNIYFDSSTASRYTHMNSAGNFGIQRDNPRVALDVNGDTIVGELRFNNSATSGSASISSSTSGLLLTSSADRPVRVTMGSLLVGYGGNGAIFGTNANLLVASNVGIGTTTPAYSDSNVIFLENMTNLSLQGALKINTSLYIQNTGGTTGYIQLTPDSGGSGYYSFATYNNDNNNFAFIAQWEAQIPGGGDALIFYWGATSPPPLNPGGGPRGSGSYSIEFDHYNDQVRLYYDTTQLTSVSLTHGNSTTWFPYKVISFKNNIQVYYNNNLIINYTDTGRNMTRLTNPSWGFTAWTGAFVSAHRIRAIRIEKIPVDPPYALAIDTTTDVPAINPDAYNSLIVAEDMSGISVRSGTLSGIASYLQNNYVQLTPAQSNANGQYYWNINPGNAFVADWEAQTTGSGDLHGFFWGMNTAPPSSAVYGQSAGYTVVFDDYGDNIKLYFNGSLLATSASFFLGGGTNWIKCRVVYQRNTIRVYYDNTLYINFKDTARTYSSNHFMGYHSWTGGAFCDHRIRDIRIQKLHEGVWSYQSQTSANIIFNGGNVGINTSTPAYTLDVSGTGRGTLGISVPYGTGSVSMQTTNGSINTFMETVSSGSLDLTNIYTPGNNSSTPKISIQSNNLVGINTSTPAYTLDVNASSANFAIRAVGSQTDSPVIRFENSNASGGRTYHVGSSGTGSGAGRGWSIFDVTASVSRMLIGSTGNVGIGTTTPSGALDISFANTVPTIRSTYSGMTAGDNDMIIFGQGNSTNNSGIIDFNYVTSGSTSNSIGLGFFGGINQMVVTANGNIGICTTNPANALHVVSGNATDAMTLENTNASGFAAIRYKTPSREFFSGVGGASSGNFADKWYVTGFGTVVLTTNGNFGIGTTSPVAPLHVATSSLVTIGAFRYYAYNGNVHVGNFSGQGITSIYAAERVVAQEFNAFSDQRIKKDIVDVSDSSALSILRQIEPKQYKYRDVASKGTQPVWGFVAQQVRSVLDYATDLRTDFLPNIYQVADVTNTHTITLSTATTTDLIVNQRIRLIKSDDELVETKITGIVDAHTFTVEDILSTDKVFVFGSEVEDFHTLNKDAIFTIATAALQEVDRALQAKKARTASLTQFIQSKYPGELLV